MVHPDPDPDDEAEPLVIREPWFNHYPRERHEAAASAVLARGGAWIAPFMGED